MPTSKPPKPDPNQELTERRIAEFAVEEARLSAVAYRFQLVPRDRVWKNWDRTEFEPNGYKIIGLAGVCLTKDESEKAHRTAVRALEEVEEVQFNVGQPAQAIIVRGGSGTSEIINRPTIVAEVIARQHSDFDRALEALDAAFPGGRVAGKVVSEE
jgi:hypothetical protein